MAQLFQAGWGASPWQAGVWLLPMAAMPMLVTPVGGLLGDRFGPRPLLAAGAALVATGLAWTAVATDDYSALVPALVMIGAGSGLFFAPVAAAVLAAVNPDDQGRAAGVASATRELAAVLGVAVLGAVLAGHPGTTGIRLAMGVGAALAATGALAALTINKNTEEKNDATLDC
jgi:MFS family permease